MFGITVALLCLRGRGLHPWQWCAGGSCGVITCLPSEGFHCLIVWVLHSFPPWPVTDAMENVISGSYLLLPKPKYHIQRWNLLIKPTVIEHLFLFSDDGLLNRGEAQTEKTINKQCQGWFWIANQYGTVRVGSDQEMDKYVSSMLLSQSSGNKFP